MSAFKIDLSLTHFLTLPSGCPVIICYTCDILLYATHVKVFLTCYVLSLILRKDASNRNETKVCDHSKPSKRGKFVHAFIGNKKTIVYKNSFLNNQTLALPRLFSEGHSHILHISTSLRLCFILKTQP